MNDLINDITVLRATTFLRTTVTRDMPWDRVLAGDNHAPTSQQRRGAKLFFTRADQGDRARRPLVSPHPPARRGLPSGPRRAVEHLRAAVRLEPAVPENFINLGDAVAGTGDLRGATDAYRSALVLGADTLKLWHNLGIVLANTGRSAEAQDAFGRAALRARAPLRAPGAPVRGSPRARAGCAPRPAEPRGAQQPWRGPREARARAQEAAAAYDRALAVAPDFAPVLQGRARLRAALSAK